MSDPNLPANTSGGPLPAGYEHLGALDLTTKFFPLAFLLFIFPAKITLDGGAELAHGWGRKTYPIPAGRHTVRAWCPYWFVMKMGDMSHTIDVRPGEVVTLEWKCPWLVFLPGQWLALGSRALGAQDLQGVPPGFGLGAGQAPAPAPQPAPVPPAATYAVETPAGWHPDPQGQAALRYWDGTQWTDHVSDGQASPA